MTINREFVWDLILSEVLAGVDLSEQRELLAELYQADSRLARKLDNAVSGNLCALLEAGFVAGWQTCKNPESVIFVQSDKL